MKYLGLQQGKIKKKTWDCFYNNRRVYEARHVRIVCRGKQIHPVAYPKTSYNDQGVSN